MPLYDCGGKENLMNQCYIEFEIKYIFFKNYNVFVLYTWSTVQLTSIPTSTVEKHDVTTCRPFSTVFFRGGCGDTYEMYCSCIVYNPAIHGQPKRLPASNIIDKSLVYLGYNYTCLQLSKRLRPTYLVPDIKNSENKTGDLNSIRYIYKYIYSCYAIICTECVQR